METGPLVGGELVAAAGAPLAVENPARTEHVHIETERELKEWRYPYEH